MLHHGQIRATPAFPSVVTFLPSFTSFSSLCLLPSNSLNPLSQLGSTSVFKTDHSYNITVIGFPALAINLLIEALLQRRYLGTDSKGGNIACVAFIYLFIVLFQFIDAPSFVWCAEIFPTTIRAKGVGLAMFGYFVGFITFSTPGPLAFRNM